MSRSYIFSPSSVSVAYSGTVLDLIDCGRTMLSLSPCYIFHLSSPLPKVLPPLPEGQPGTAWGHP
jgi:hypothetical protein